MHRLRRHLTYANVVATLALVLAAAGGTTALAVAIQGSKKSSDVNRTGNIRSGRVTAKKIADGSVTAAKLAGIDVVEANDTGGNATATCPGGERLISGGARMNSIPPSVAIVVSAPKGNGWNAVTNASSNLNAYALCLKPSPGL